jgi:hypothetical protein
MPFTVILPVLIAVACCTLALGIMVGHAIGYRKAEIYWIKRYNVLKVKLGSVYGRVPNEPLTVHKVQGQHVRRKS